MKANYYANEEITSETFKSSKNIQHKYVIDKKDNSKYVNYKVYFRRLKKIIKEYLMWQKYYIRIQKITRKRQPE